MILDTGIGVFSNLFKFVHFICSSDNNRQYADDAGTFLTRFITSRFALLFYRLTATLGSLYRYHSYFTFPPFAVFVSYEVIWLSLKLGW